MFSRDRDPKGYISFKSYRTFLKMRENMRSERTEIAFETTFNMRHCAARKNPCVRRFSTSTIGNEFVGFLFVRVNRQVSL